VMGSCARPHQRKAKSNFSVDTCVKPQPLVACSSEVGTCGGFSTTLEVYEGEGQLINLVPIIAPSG
jgi:hypothetical protein